MLFGAGLEDDWTSPAVWARANPSLGLTVKRDYLEQECRRARDMPSYENTFKRLHLNMWTEAETRWLSMEQWDVGAARSIVRRSAGGRASWAWTSSSTKDLSALVALFPDARRRLRRVG